MGSSWSDDQNDNGSTAPKVMGGCCSPDDTAEKSLPTAKENVEASQHVGMRENRDSVDHILHFPDDSQQFCVLEHMQGNLQRDLELYNSAPQQLMQTDPVTSNPYALGPVPVGPGPGSARSLSPQPAPAPSFSTPSSGQGVSQVNVALVQRQIQLYNQLIGLVQQQQQELAKANAAGPVVNSFGLTAYQPTPVPIAAPAKAPAFGANPYSQSVPPLAAANSAPTQVLTKSPTPAASVPTALSVAPAPALTLDPASLIDNGGMNDAKRDAYQSLIVEADSNALARLLKKHFNNFVLECEFNASGNVSAYEILRSRRCDRLEVDNNCSSSHNLTIPKTKSVADLFLRYCMAVIDAQHWGGELRYVIKRPASEIDHAGSICINGSISYLSSDKLMKLDAPYQLEVIFMLAQNE